MHAPTPIDHVGAHALVRWIERVEGVDLAAVRKSLGLRDRNADDRALLDHLEVTGAVDLEATRQKILGDDLRTAIALGMPTFKRGEVTFVLKKSRLITILGPGQRPKRRLPNYGKSRRIKLEDKERKFRKQRAKWGK